MSAPDIPSHESPIKTPKQLVITILLAFIVPIIIIVMLAVLVTSNPHPDSDSPGMAPDKVTERIKPVADVVLGAPGGGGQALRTGEEIYKGVCLACHGAGVAGAPKFGDKAAWAPILRAGQKSLVQLAIKGKGPMPPRGGAADLTDLEVERAVVYMANAAGAKFKEPAVPAQAPAASAASASSPAAGPQATAGGKADGKKVFESTCSVCHAAGVAGAPKLGDKAAWAPHLAHGLNDVYQTALKGKGAMPPKGGNLSLSEAEVKAAVDYMVSTVKFK
ncbi:MAG: cytochrome c5 family protein [Betaproteobacteria bacterium]|nr:cytochrome c5 family protein [Betaproteobacteria bacterium]